MSIKVSKPTLFQKNVAIVPSVQPITITTTYDKVFNNPNVFSTSNVDSFSTSMALTGNYAIITAHNEDDAGGAQSGVVYIFDITTGSLVHTINNPNAYSTTAGDSFGWSLGASGDFMVVGAPYEDELAGPGSGKAYIFNVNTGSLIATLNNPNAFSTVDADGFGVSVAMDGNYVIVGATGEDDVNSTTQSGKAYIFKTTNGLWTDTTLVHTLDNPNPFSTSESDWFAGSLDIDGNYAIVGAYGEDEAAGTDSGKAYIYDVTTGSLLHTLDNPNAYGTPISDWFGRTVSISGNYAVVTTLSEDDAGGTGSGKVYIFNVTTGSLLHTLDNPNAYGTGGLDEFGGYAAHVNGNYVIVGARQEDDAGGLDSGKAYIFDVTTGNLLSTLDNPNAFSTSAGDWFGRTVAINNNYALVGALGEDDVSGNFSGKAYLFSIT